MEQRMAQQKAFQWGHEMEQQKEYRLARVGAEVGTRVGAKEGTAVGRRVGAKEGSRVGTGEG